MWVAPDARGAGMGRALLDAVETSPRERGCDRLALTVTETNAVARTFYDVCGFTESGDRSPRHLPSARRHADQGAAVSADGVATLPR